MILARILYIHGYTLIKILEELRDITPLVKSIKVVSVP